MLFLHQLKNKADEMRNTYQPGTRLSNVMIYRSREREYCLNDFSHRPVRSDAATPLCKPKAPAAAEYSAGITYVHGR